MPRKASLLGVTLVKKVGGKREGKTGSGLSSGAIGPQEPDRLPGGEEVSYLEMRTGTSLCGFPMIWRSTK